MDKTKDKRENVQAMPSKVILMMTFKIEFKTESRTLQGSKFDFKNQDSRIIKIKIQESRADLIKISIKKFFKTLSSTRSFHKIITKEFYSLVIDYQKVVIDYQ